MLAFDFEVLVFQSLALSFSISAFCFAPFAPFAATQRLI
jgi:hypothetical protein